MGSISGKYFVSTQTEQSEVESLDSQEDVQTDHIDEKKIVGRECQIRNKEIQEQHLSASLDDCRQGIRRESSRTLTLGMQNINLQQKTTNHRSKFVPQLTNKEQQLPEHFEQSNYVSFSEIFQKRQKVFKTQWNLPDSGDYPKNQEKRDALISPEYQQLAYDIMLEKESGQTVSNVHTFIQRRNVFLQRTSSVQPQTISMKDRSRAVKRLVKLCRELDYSEEVIHLAIGILDKAIAINYPDINRHQLQLAMVTSLVISAKLLVNSQTHIHRIVEKLTSTEAVFITTETLVRSERVFLLQLDFDLDLVTSYTFLQHLLQFANVSHESHIGTEARLIMLEYKIRTPSSELKPSRLAGASLYYAMIKVQKTDKSRENHLSKPWSDKMEARCNISY